MAMDERPRILCVGLVCHDIISVVASYPKEDSDQRASDQRWVRGGNASNMCTVLKQLNASCEFLGTMAVDNSLSFLTSDFVAQKIPFDNCVYHENCKTPTSIAIINENNGSRTIIHGNKNLPELTLDDFRKINLTSNRYKWIHFEGRHNCENIPLMLDLIDKYNSSTSDESKHILTSVELEKQLEAHAILLDKADFVYISKEYAQFRGYDNMEDAVRHLSKAVRNGATIICPWGEAGAAALSTKDQVLHISPSFPPATVVDTLGAGDTFIAATTLSLSQNVPVKEAITYGCKVAGGKVGMHGFDGLREMFGGEMK